MSNETNNAKNAEQHKHGAVTKTYSSENSLYIILLLGSIQFGWDYQQIRVIPNLDNLVPEGNMVLSVNWVLHRFFDHFDFCGKPHFISKFQTNVYYKWDIYIPGTFWTLARNSANLSCLTPYHNVPLSTYQRWREIPPQRIALPVHDTWINY